MYNELLPVYGEYGTLLMLGFNPFEIGDILDGTTTQR